VQKKNINKWSPGKDNNFAENLPLFLGNSVININQTHNTPYSYFTQIFTDDIFEHIRVETIRYAVQNGKDSFTLTKTELKTYFAINIAMTYLRYPNVRMYWSSLPGIRMNLIADAMNVNRFGEIKRFLHFEDNTKKPDSAVSGYDRYWKLRPVITMLHDSFHAAASPDEHIAIDEMIIPFKGRSGLKQYMKAKPKKWGFKVWVQANRNGYVNCFHLYQGQCKSAVRSNFRPIGDSVLKLCHDMQDKNHKLFMDNLFTSLPLLRQLRTFNIFVIGTLRANRTPDVKNYSSSVFFKFFDRFYVLKYLKNVN